MSELEGISTDIEWIKESLTRIESRLDDMDTGCRGRHHELDVELSALKMRAGFYGAMAGALPTVVTVLLLLLKGR
jgi:hypothetical protein